MATISNAQREEKRRKLARMRGVNVTEIDDGMLDRAISAGEVSDSSASYSSGSSSYDSGASSSSYDSGSSSSGSSSSGSSD